MSGNRSLANVHVIPDPVVPAREDVPYAGTNAYPAISDAVVQVLALREKYRDAYWQRKDPILDHRLLWRAQTLRHTVHVLPGACILELGCGTGRFTHALRQITRGENPITTVTFDPSAKPTAFPDVEHLTALSLPGPLQGRQFDCIVAMDLVDNRTSSELLCAIFELLSPSGELILYESNPWNPILRIRAAFARMIGRGDPRALVSRPRLYELLSEIGFIRVYAAFNDFVYAPLTPRLIWLLRNLSILLENAPGISRTAGSLLVHAQKPPRRRSDPSCCFVAQRRLKRAVSVVVPCHNEEGNVEPLVAQLLRLYSDYIHEIVLVNDGSRDRTGALIDEMARRDARIIPLHRRPPNGVGLAIADGLRAASGRYALTMDCDFQHLLPELRDIFAAAAEGYDVVIGSRFSRHSVLLNYPFAKILANRTFHTIARSLLRTHFRDVTNNLKLMTREVLDRLVLTQPGFAVNAETGLQPYLLGYRVHEVPISWINRTPGMGVSSFRLLKVGGGYGRVLLNLWKAKLMRRGPYAALSTHR
jgi:dolichol-phosphate mannosyltransferase